MNVVGLDLSLSATGVCGDTGARVVSSKLHGAPRLIDIRNAIIQAVWGSDLVCVEGFAMGVSRQAGTFEIGGLGWVCRVAMHELRIAYIDVPPATLKKFATGKGNAGKPDMLAAAIRSGYEGPNDDNAVDAWWLRQVGIYANTDEPDREFDRAYRDEAVAKLEWPAHP